MDKYKVKMLPHAFRDVEGIYEYIATEKLSPQNAKGQTDRIKRAIKSLATMPESHQERFEGRYAGKGYRQLVVDNYIVIFRINEIEKIVFVVTVQYQGRNI
ncbi:MAG: type II toxin-antitoxin system RelE/ParE family toxin [Mogibacterium sp.]|nr:type II toxin-antitoxin system RelE/ParE family toxin [Mogibacterium sp.]